MFSFPYAGYDQDRYNILKVKTRNREMNVKKLFALLYPTLWGS